MAPGNASTEADREEYLEYCKSVYSFLEKEFGFRIVLQDKIDGAIQWKTETTGVWLTHEPWGGPFPYVRLCRLVDGEFPPDPGKIRPEPVLHCYNSLDLIQLRLGQDVLSIYYPPEQDDGGRKFRARVADQAEKVRECAGDVLRGDFSIFKKLDGRVKAHARKYPDENAESWLRLTLDVREKRFLGRRLLVRIRFENISAEPADLPFCNIKRQAELLGLGILDESERCLEPLIDYGLHIRPKRPLPPPRRLKPGGSWSYTLKGRIREDQLLFVGAGYQLQPGTRYRIRFGYLRVFSNTVEWVYQ